MGHSLVGIANLMLMERLPHKIDLAVFVAASVAPTGVALTQELSVLTLVSHRLHTRQGREARDGCGRLLLGTCIF